MSKNNNKNKYKHIKDYRTFVLKSLGNKCSECDSKINLRIHHKRYQKELEIEDLVILCSNCHAKEHSIQKRPKLSSNSFEAQVSKSGRRRIITVPNILKTFQSGDEVKVTKRKVK